MKGYFPSNATIPQLWSRIVERAKVNPFEGGPILHMHMTGTSIWSEPAGGVSPILVAMDVGCGILMVLDLTGDSEYRMPVAEFNKRIRPHILATLP